MSTTTSGFRNKRGPKHGPFITRVISNESEVPPGFVSLQHIRESQGLLAAKVASQKHAAGLVPAVKLMRTTRDNTGPVWLAEAEWNAMWGSVNPPPKPAAPAQAAPPPAVQEHGEKVLQALQAQQDLLRECLHELRAINALWGSK